MNMEIFDCVPTPSQSRCCSREILFIALQQFPSKEWTCCASSSFGDFLAFALANISVWKKSTSVWRFVAELCISKSGSEDSEFADILWDASVPLYDDESTEQQSGLHIHWKPWRAALLIFVIRTLHMKFTTAFMLTVKRFFSIWKLFSQIFGCKNWREKKSVLRLTTAKKISQNIESSVTSRVSLYTVFMIDRKNRSKETTIRNLMYLGQTNNHNSNAQSQQ